MSTSPAAAPRGLRGVLALGGSALPVFAFLARLPAALCPIGTLLLINARDGIGEAGAVAAALWLGQAVGGPVIGRLADRRGHRPVLLAACAANATVLAALVAAVLGGLPPAARIALAVAAGLTVPQVGPLARARWARLAGPDKALLGSALSFDTTLDEVGFMVGPALAGILAVTVHPASALVLAAVLILVFGTLFAVHPTAPGPVEAAGARADVRLWSPGLLLLFALALLQGAAWGGANTGVNALARALGEPGTAGLVWSAMAVTSSVAGFVTVARPGSADLTVRLRWTIAVQALLTLPLLAVSGLWGATFAVAGIGLAVAPHLIALFGLVERAGPAERMGEAMTVLGSGLIVGQALAAAVAGPLAGAYGYRAAFAVACAAAAASAVLALTCTGPAAGTAASPDAGTTDGAGGGTTGSASPGTADGPGAGTASSPGAGATHSPGTGTAGTPGAGTTDSRSAGAPRSAGTADSPGAGAASSPGAGANARRWDRLRPALSPVRTWPPAPSPGPPGSSPERPRPRR
ncbi:MFS transporter [Streptomyces sp. NBC_01551]|uniref:MFS transporter n=1 Tax=Streptomyces sp. NBC_01551 TaxID=2975876 RepID=UPI002259C65E|nr:MFS transporter [Streptomyces sp. NBC_01551]MCX4525994.1 MFS transporter [Streptomyces sp. NBC_01551]